MGLSLFVLLAILVVVPAPRAEASGSIGFRAASRGTNDSGATTLTIPVPDGVVAGDVMLAGVTHRDDADWTRPDGWDRVEGNGNSSVFYRIAGGDEPSSYSWELSVKRAAVGIIVAYSGVDVGDPIQTFSGQYGDKDDRIVAPSVTTTVDRSRVVGFFRTNRDTDIAKPSEMTERIEVSESAGKDLTMNAADVGRTNAGNTGDKVAVADTSGTTSGQLVVLTPAGGDPDPDPDPEPDPEPDPSPDPVLRVEARDSRSAEATWTLPDGAVTTQVYRDGRLLDEFPSSASTTYADYLLWKSSTYTYEVRWLDSEGKLIEKLSEKVTTPAQASSFPTLYSGTSFWNKRIGSNPAIDPNSSAMVDKALVPYESTSNFANSDDWGIPIAYATWPSEIYSVACTRYDCDVPVSARISKYASASTGSDHHLAVMDESTDEELDMWLGSHDPAKDKWSAGSRYVTDQEGTGTFCGTGRHCNGATASGFALGAGLIRPEEIAQGHIDHALVVMTPYTRADYIACPATASDGKYDDEAALPEGAQIQLDPSFNVDAQSWPRWLKVIAHALQDYGAYVGDTGGSLAIRGESDLIRGYDAWAKAGIDGTPYLMDLPWDRFRVLELSEC